MKFIIILLFLLNTLYFGKVLSADEYLDAHVLLLNNKYYNISKLNEDCVIDYSSFTGIIERGIGKSNCENGLTCFNFKCVRPSNEGDHCEPYTFKVNKNIALSVDKSNCTAQYYCHNKEKVCKKTVALGGKCESDYECASKDYVNATCREKTCVDISYNAKENSNNRFIVVFIFMSVLIYIYYKQYKIQEYQLNRLNELYFENDFAENHRRNSETETLPPYTPPSQAFLSNNDDAQCSNTPPLRSPPKNLSLNVDTNRLIVRRLSQYSVSTNSSQLPSTPPPSYSQPTSPYTYNVALLGDDINEEVILPPTITIPNSNTSDISQPPAVVQSNSLSRINSRFNNFIFIIENEKKSFIMHL
ncbi:hypothetical protein BCR32DRAFT_247819 [Anaeromyces robustus]|uniref:EB domain-containing protein n=1 Tax=Anaeromyces robustus TaxID=1754192 RepID=A0A1Y1WVN8_9FUNG|nr:hypothetical protein BCR32DRAFT_247819 [Anaeromyces robustus]|eukprot:ORX77600.1 hypothetical protein BCR32DRAFT_247819 [Anaeromyces robustus]